MKPYGFKVITENTEKEFHFTGRDWSLLTSFEDFSNLGTMFQNLVGMNALEFPIGTKKYCVYVTRTKRYFLSQLSGVSDCFESEKEDLLIDYSIVIPGVQDSPVKRIHCEYMGFSANVSCNPGFCMIKAYEAVSDGTVRDTIKIDLRRFTEFKLDRERMIRLRKKKRESDIATTLAMLKKYIEEDVHEESFEIELVGGH